jgi:hypothetical protein
MEPNEEQKPEETTAPAAEEVVTPTPEAEVETPAEEAVPASEAPAEAEPAE